MTRRAPGRRAPIRLEPRGRRAAPRAFHQGTRAPFGIRWYGVTSLWGHFRNFVSTAIARECVDTRDWMRPLSPDELLENVACVLGLDRKATLVESLGRPLVVDWVADTGDDRDVSKAVARMIFAEYTTEEDGALVSLPRGDVLLFGGDTAYPVATTDEIQRRLVEPWNEVLREAGPPDRARVLVGIPGNHDWYDGLDGFCRLFRRRAPSPDGAPEAREPEGLSVAHDPHLGRLARGLHVDEVGGLVDLLRSAGRAALALWRGTNIRHRRWLELDGYVPVQESSYWALPIAPSLELWGTDRQLGRLDYRQRSYFCARPREGKAVWIVAPDPAIAFGDPWDFGQRILDACDLSLERDRVLYQCGDMHQYERRVLGRSMQVIAGGGGAFLHGTRIVADPAPAAVAYPDAKTTRRLALEVPFRLMLGRAGYLIHLAAAALASVELAIGWHARGRLLAAAAVVSALAIWVLYAIAGHNRAHPRRTLALAVPFGIALGTLPLWLKIGLRAVAGAVPLLERDLATLIVSAFVGALLFGTFLALCALGGLEMQQVFTVLGHPGFKHFVRMRVSADGTVDAWTIGKDDPLAPHGPWLVDRWTWKSS